VNRGHADLGIAAAMAVLACAAAVLHAPAAVMAMLGAALFAAPGYLLSRLLPGPDRGGLERLAVAAGLALSVPVTGGLLLYAAGRRLDRTSWLLLLTAVTLAADLMVYLRRRHGRTVRPGREERGWRIPPRHAAAFAAAVVTACCAVGLARQGAAAQHYPGYTQLWADRIPGNAATVRLGVGNHEGRTTRFLLVYVDNGRRAASWRLVLADGQSWQRSQRAAAGHAVRAELFRLPDASRPYRYVALAAAPSS
jgi:uncharacterized membrane protein